MQMGDTQFACTPFQSHQAQMEEIFSRDLRVQDTQGLLSILSSAPTEKLFWWSVGESGLISLPFLESTGKDQSPEDSEGRNNRYTWQLPGDREACAKALSYELCVGSTSSGM